MLREAEWLARGNGELAMGKEVLYEPLKELHEKDQNPHYIYLIDVLTQMSLSLVPHIPQSK